MLMASDYYMVEATALEWIYVIEETIVHPLKDTLEMGEAPDVILNEVNGNPVYYLKKSKFPAELLAAKFDTTVELINGSKVIRLEPFETSGDLPKPTVPYYGIA